MPGSFNTTPERSRLMQKVRQRNTEAECTVRKFLYSRGFRFRVNVRYLPGSPDIVNRSWKWAIFVHGCFWHAHQGCPKWTLPKNNRSYWQKKFLGNTKRGKKNQSDLQVLGFRVLILWECELSESTMQKKILPFLAKLYVPKTQPTTAPPDSKTVKSPEGYNYTQSFKFVNRSVLSRRGTRYVTRHSVGDYGSPCRYPHLAFDRALLQEKVPRRSNGRSSIVRGVDLFCGCGGLSLGAQEACRAIGRRFVSQLAVDNDTDSLKVYQDNFKPQNIIEADIASIVDGSLNHPPTVAELSWLKNFRKTHLLLAGPPCQGHSDLNNHTRRLDDRNQLYLKIARFAELTNPVHIVAENVPTIVHSHERVLDHTTSFLERLGYFVETGIVDLAELGVPQNRKRHVLIASLRKTLSIRTIVARYRVAHPRSIRWAIEDLEGSEDASAFDGPTIHSRYNQERIKHLFENGLYNLPNEFRPTCHQNGNHSYKSMYGRLRYNDPAQTITCGFLSPGQGRFIHPNMRRTLTPHEAARLQFFPDWFSFSSLVGRTSLAKMIGNAVPMKLGYVFCLELLR